MNLYFNQDGGSQQTTESPTWHVRACNINKATGKHVRHNKFYLIFETQR